MLKNWCFWIVVLEKTFENPVDCKEIKPDNLKGNKPWILIGRTCWSWSFNTLATWCEELTHWKRPWCWERGQKEKRWQGMRWLHSITDSVDMNLSKLREMVKDRGAWHAAVHRVTKSQTPLSNNWIEGSLVCCSPWSHRAGHDLVTEQQQIWPKKDLMNSHSESFCLNQS